MSALVQDSKSSASVFCPYHGFFTFTFLMVICLLIKMCMVHAGEFSKVIPSNKTLLQPVNRIIFGRRKSLIDSNEESVAPPTNFPILLVSEPCNAPAEGYQFVLSSLKTPPALMRRFHSVSVTFPFLSGRHASPPPLKIP